jgi:hypothetical protein
MTVTAQYLAKTRFLKTGLKLPNTWPNNDKHKGKFDVTSDIEDRPTNLFQGQNLCLRLSNRPAEYRMTNVCT